MKKAGNEISSKNGSQADALNVIYTWNYLQWGGAQIYLLSIIRNAPSNWHFTLIIPKNSRPDLIKFFEPYGVEFVYVDASLYEEAANTVLSKIRRQWHRIRAEFAVYRELRKFDPASSLVHLDMPPWQSWILLYLLTNRMHVFFTLHNAISTTVAGWRAKIWRGRLNLLFKQPRFHVFAANKNAIDSMRFYLDESDVDKIALTRAAINPVEIDEVLECESDSKSLLEKHGLPADKFIVLCLGQFIDRKGRWIFLEAAREILRHRNDIAFAWISPRLPDENELKRIEEYRLGPDFRYLLSENIGTTRLEVLTFLRTADVFALPSLWEGLPISILEAMALKVPTISTNVNAIPEALIDGETGILVEPGSVEALVAAILRIEGDPDIRKRLSERGREHVLAHFDEREAAKVALEHYAHCFKRQINVIG